MFSVYPLSTKSLSETLAEIKRQVDAGELTIEEAD